MTPDSILYNIILTIFNKLLYGRGEIYRIYVEKKDGGGGLKVRGPVSNVKDFLPAKTCC